MNLRKTKDCKIFCFFCLHTTRLLKANIYVYRIYVFFFQEIYELFKNSIIKKQLSKLLLNSNLKVVFENVVLVSRYFDLKVLNYCAIITSRAKFLKNNSIYPVLKYNYIVSSTCNAHLKKLRANSSPEVFMVCVGQFIMTRAHETMKRDPWIT